MKKNNWPVKKLGEICTLISRGRTPKYGNGKAFAIKSAQVYDPLRLTDCTPITDKFADSNKSFALNKDDILLNGTGTGTLGRSSFVYEELRNVYIPDSHINLIRTDKSQILLFFVYAWLQSKDGLQAINTSFTGSTNQIELNASSVRGFRLPVPPLKIQHKIVERLDAIRKAQELCDQQIQKTEELFESLIFKELENLDLEEKILGSVCDFQYGYTQSAKDTGKYRFIRITDIDDSGELKNGDEKFISDDLKLLKSYVLNEGDLLVARTGATYGKVLYFNSNQASVFASFLIRIIPNTSTILPKFIWLFSRSKSYWDQAKRLVSGTGQPQFNANKLKQIKIKIPDLKKQQKIVEKLEAVQNYKKLLTKQKELLKELLILF